VFVAELKKERKKTDNRFFGPPQDIGVTLGVKKHTLSTKERKCWGGGKGKNGKQAGNLVLSGEGVWTGKRREKKYIPLTSKKNLW